MSTCDVSRFHTNWICTSHFSTPMILQRNWLRRLITIGCAEFFFYTQYLGRRGMRRTIYNSLNTWRVGFCRFWNHCAIGTREGMRGGHLHVRPGRGADNWRRLYIGKRKWDTWGQSWIGRCWFSLRLVDRNIRTRNEEMCIIRQTKGRTDLIDTSTFEFIASSRASSHRHSCVMPRYPIWYAPPLGFSLDARITLPSIPLNALDVSSQKRMI